MSCIKLLIILKKKELQQTILMKLYIFRGIQNYFSLLNSSELTKRYYFFLCDLFLYQFRLQCIYHNHNVHKKKIHPKYNEIL